MPGLPAAVCFAAFASQVETTAVPTPVLSAAKLHLLDVLGCALAASAVGSGVEGRAVAEEAGSNGRATVVGAPTPRAAAAAALANGMLAHALDFDDTHPGSICHVSTLVAPAALAAAEQVAGTGADLLAALVAGNEVVARVGAPAAGRYMRTGFHPTSVCGIFGAVAAASRARRTGSETCANALGIAGSMASGIFEYLSDGSATKPIHAGWAAQAAVTALDLACAGATGPASVLEGRFGLYASYYGLADLDLDAELRDLGTRWETLEIAYKPYPACHFVHSFLDAIAFALNGSVSPDEVEEVLLSVPEAAVPLVLEPAEAKAAPRTEYEAKFSLPYSVAAMIVDGRVGIDTYVLERLGDERIRNLAAVVRYEVRDFAAGTSFPGAVTIRLRDGRSLEAELLHQRGGRENPMSADDVIAKFRDNASLALDEEPLELLQSAVLMLEEQETLAAFKLLGTASTREAIAA